MAPVLETPRLEHRVRGPASSAWGRAARAIVAGGLLAGALDILAAFAVYAPRGVSPVRILQSVASGIHGPAAFRGGASMAAMGLALHFFIATTAAAVFWAASRAWPVLRRRPLVFGALYGVAVYGVMNFVVVPLSAAARRPFDPTMAAIMVGIHITCVGIPIALAVSRLAEPPPDPGGHP